MSDRVASPLLDALQERVVVADGAMGTMSQSWPLTLDDFAGLDGCNEILNVTRPDVVRSVHRGYLEAGADAIETNTFGANPANLGEYGIAERIRELSARGAVKLLEPERIDVRLSEEFQLHPEQATDALVAHHPEAKYFNA